MSVKKRWFLFLSVFFFSVSTHAAVFNPKAKFETVATDHFNIHFQSELKDSAMRLATIAEQVHAVLSPKLEWKPWGKTHVILIDASDAANGLANVIPNNYVLLHLAPPRPDSNLFYYSDYLTLLFVHEYTHILHLDAYGGAVTPLRWLFGKIMVPNAATPGWIREGWATYQESDETGYGRANSSYTDMVLRTDLLHDRFLPIDRASGVHIHWPGSRTQYLYGAAFWKWLVDSYGEERVTAFHHRNRESLKLFAINSRAKKVFGKTFYALWEEWQTCLSRNLQSLKTRIGEPSATRAFISDTQANYFIWAKNGRDYAYGLHSIDDKPTIQSNRADQKSAKRLRNIELSGQLSWSADGKRLAYSAAQKKPYTAYSTLFIYDFNGKKARALVDDKKNPVRGFDPDFHPTDAQLVYVCRTSEHEGLCLYDEESKSVRYLMTGQANEQFFNPRFSPDGKAIAVVRFNRGHSQLLRVDAASARPETLFEGTHHLLYPAWHPDGGSIVYSADAGGIYNLYSLSLENQSNTPLTNTLSGVFQPNYRSDGALYAQVYTQAGFEIHEIITTHDIITPPAPSYLKRGEPEISSSSCISKPYTAFTSSLVLPRYLLPLWAIADENIFIGVLTGGHDPLLRHLWNATVNYLSGPSFVGFGADYIYNRYTLRPYLSANRYAVNFGDVFGVGDDFYEERWRAAIGLDYHVKTHSMSGNYFFEDRDAYTQQNQNIAALNLGHYSGFHLSYGYRRNLERVPAAISVEKGLNSSFSFDITDEVLGSDTDNEQRVFVGDTRYFFELPWSNHHVLAVRGTGGITFGDNFVQRTFVLGGDLGESPLARVSRRTFSLRGVPFAEFSGERAMVFSAEYRLPLVWVERGIGTWPLFLNQLHWAFFADYGDIFNKNIRDRDGKGFFDEFMLGVGSELRGDFVVGHGLPITGRLGYGIIVINRDRVTGRSADWSGADAKYGTVIVQLGTSF